MADLETRLTEALRDGAGGAPSVIGLAGAARSRARAKRRHRIAAGAAVVALAAGVPVAVVAADGSTDRDSTGATNQGGGKDVIHDPAPGQSGLPDGYHYESWHDVTVEVPDTWGYGPLGSWCAGGGSPDTPRVSRPSDVAEAIACEPASAYGVSFQQVDNTDDFRWPTVHQSEGWPGDALVGGRGMGGILVMASASEEGVADHVLDSMRRNTGLDPNGCPVHLAPGASLPPEGGLAICRFDDTGWLEQSEVLFAQDAGTAVQVLQRAPAATALGCTDASQGSQPHAVITLEAPGIGARVDLVDGCPRVTVDGDVRELTPDVLYWALSPGWSGSVPGGVSLPSVLRSH